MAEISTRHVDALNEALLRLYEPCSLATFPERLFELMTMVAPGHFMHLSVTKAGFGAVDAFMSAPAHRELMELVERREEVQRMPGVSDNTFYLTADHAPTSFHDLVSRRTLESTVLWEAFCRPLKLEYDLSVNFHRSDDLFYTISSSRNRRPYSTEERRTLSWLQPHLRQRFQQMLAAEPGHPLGRPANSTLNVPWLLCSDDGRVLGMAPGTNVFLQKSNQRISGRLPSVWRDWLRTQLSPVTAESTHLPLLIEGPKGCLVVHCLRNLYSRQHRLIMELKPSAGPPLTCREKEVGRWLVDGKTNEEIANILGISRATVKVHVEHILGKLRVENRTAAARILQGLAVS